CRRQFGKNHVCRPGHTLAWDSPSNVARTDWRRCQDKCGNDHAHSRGRGDGAKARLGNCECGGGICRGGFGQRDECGNRDGARANCIRSRLKKIEGAAKLRDHCEVKTVSSRAKRGTSHTVMDHANWPSVCPNLRMRGSSPPSRTGMTAV